MFVPPTVKEVGCLTTGVNERSCLESVGGPATCNRQGLYYSNLTIDASPETTNVKTLYHAWGPVPRFNPAIILLLREPVPVIRSMYNHWASYREGEDCDSCPLAAVLSCQLQFFASKNRLESIELILNRLRSGDASVSDVHEFHQRLGNEYNAMPCGGCSGVNDTNKFIYEHLYLLDVIYEFDLLVHNAFMKWDRFLVVDTNALSTYPDVVRDTFFELILGEDHYRRIHSAGLTPSWQGFASNVKDQKKSCATLSRELACEATKFLKPFNSMLFNTIRRLSRDGKVSTLSARRVEWWEPVPNQECPEW
jgi:hypothetical protein